ncbi:MAG: hypothetical protein NW200_04810 [Hyphomonadaceae bacterium]|nr:hypothetical protein [Hyphomonadaceae bacterium]
MEDEDWLHVARARAALHLGCDDDGEAAARLALVWGPDVSTATAVALKRSARRLAHLASVCARAAARLAAQ